MSAPIVTLTEGTARLRAATLDLVWRQWAALGAQVSSRGVSDGIVDPEALLLVSLGLIGHERRLADALESWVTVNAQLLSIQRLKNLLGDFPASVRLALPAVAEIAVRDAKDARWASLKEPADAATPSSLGARRGKLRAGEPRFMRYATLMLQLRRGMGVGVKADVLSYLLGVWNDRDWASTTMIATATGYTPAAVRRAADDLASARFIRSLDTVESPAAAQRMYAVEAEGWHRLLHLQMLYSTWRHWKERFAFVAAVLAETEAIAGREVSDYAASAIARELLEGHRAVLTRDRLVEPGEYAATDFAEHGTWLPFFGEVVRRLSDWMDNQS